MKDEGNSNIQNSKRQCSNSKGTQCLTLCQAAHAWEATLGIRGLTLRRAGIGAPAAGVPLASETA
jgi:hypothetical protein